MPKCPLCKGELEFADSYTEIMPKAWTPPETVYDFRCTIGNHLIQFCSPQNVWVAFSLERDGDELYSLVFNIDGTLIGISAMTDSYKLETVNLEGGTK